MNKILRQKELLAIAIKLADKIGYQKVTARMIAKKAKVPHSLIHYHFKSIKTIKRLVIKEALRNDRINIVIQAIVAKEPQVKHLLLKDFVL